MSHTFLSKSGLKFSFSQNINLQTIEFENLLVNLYPGCDIEANISNLYLKTNRNGEITISPLFGMNSRTKFFISDTGFQGIGFVNSIEYKIRFELHPRKSSWKYSVTCKNLNSSKIQFQILYIQDIGLSDTQAVQLNEFFVCHYLHHEVFETKENGYFITSRQSESVGGKNPSSLLFSSNPVVSYATDLRDIFENRNLKNLPSRRRQGEHSVLSLENEVVFLLPNENYSTEFYGHFMEHSDEIGSLFSYQKLMQETFFLSEEIQTENIPFSTTTSLFSQGKVIEGDKIHPEELKSIFTGEWREIEYDNRGNLLSFFAEDNTHIVLKEKEINCLRPHAQILRTGKSDTISESSLTTTAYYSGIFLSELTQRHVSLGQFISRVSTYLNQFLSQGFRIFLKNEYDWFLLEKPSFFVMRSSSLEWNYLWKKSWIKISVEASKEDQFDIQISILKGPPLRFLFSFHLSLDGENGRSNNVPSIHKNETTLSIRPNLHSKIYERFGGKGFFIQSNNLQDWEISNDQVLFSDLVSRGLSYLTAQIEIQKELNFHIFGELNTEPKRNLSEISPKISFPTLQFDKNLLNSNLKALAQLKEILPWFSQNAEIHFFNPRGLEQYSGGGWGVRDVCQGAFEYFLANAKWEICKDLLIRVFEEQNEDGDWPQWFMLYNRDKEIRPKDSHGDIIYWPLLALCQYIERTNDIDILNVQTFGIKQTAKRSILLSVDLAIRNFRSKMIEGTNLPMFGNGDWNDSLQPLSESFRTNSVSTWTAELLYLTYSKTIGLFKKINRIEMTEKLESEQTNLFKNIKEFCMEEGVVTGLRNFQKDETYNFLFHPKDSHTGIRYSLIPMIYGILSEVFDKEESELHVNLIKNNLTGPDGVRLFDKPIFYNQGKSQFFKRAETSSYFGREIGLMYTHAHLRYCEALAHLGKSDELLFQLNQINPIGIHSRNSSANRRQANCYYSSSDADFFDRTEASALYSNLLENKIKLEGGWRVYSSGPGIFVKLYIESFLGIKQFYDGIEFDPCLPLELNGLQIKMKILDKEVTLTYQIEKNDSSLESIVLNDVPIEFERAKNKYRIGGGKIFYGSIANSLLDTQNQLRLELK